MIKKIFSHIFCFLTTISLILLGITIILNHTVFNQDYILKTLESHDYYDKTYHQIVDNLEGYIISTGLNQDIANTFITKDKVKQDINTLINNVYQNKTTTIDTTTIDDAIDKGIQDKLSETGGRLTSEDEQNIETLKQTLGEAYLNNINYFQKYLTDITHYYQLVTHYINIIQIVLAITTIVLGLIIIIINRNIQGSVKYIITSLLSSSLLFTILGLLLKDKYNKILVFNKDFTQIVVDTLNDIFVKLFTYGLIISIISIVILIIINKPKASKELMQYKQ